MLKKIFLKKYTIILVEKMPSQQHTHYTKTHVYAYGKKDLKETIISLKDDWDNRINVDSLYEQMLNIPRGYDGVELLKLEVNFR